MTINEILQEAIEKPENWFTEGPFRGGVNWNYIDADLWTHPDAGDFTDQELFDGFEESIPWPPLSLPLLLKTPFLP